MSRFAVWDSKENNFLNEKDYAIRGDGVLVEDNYCFQELPRDRFYFFKDIGLKDINGKNIYDGSSIVEMYRGLDSFVGYYTYNKNKAHYEFIILDGCDNDSFGNIVGSSLKIIDTIQENKLGLIK